MSIVKGQPGMVLRATNRRFAPGVGWSTVFVYETADRQLANDFAGTQAAPGTNIVDLDLVGPPYRVEVSTPDAGDGTQDDSFEDVWEVPPVEQENKLLEIAEFQALPDAARQAIKAFDDKEANFEDTIAALEEVYGAGSMVAGVDPYEILLLLSKGSDSYPSPSSMLRWTRIVGKSYAAVAAAYANVNYVWSLNTLVGSLPMPANIAAAVTEATAALEAPSPGYSKGWLKKQPNILLRGNNRYEIVQEWQLESWNDWLYFNI